jgi:hypothetical protein
MRTLRAYLPALLFILAFAGAALGWHVHNQRKQDYCSHPARIAHYQECLKSPRPLDAHTAAGDQYNGLLVVAIVGMSILTVGVALRAIFIPRSLPPVA